MIKMYKLCSIQTVLLTFFALFFFSSRAQINLSDSCAFVPMFSVVYSFQIPGGDMTGQFGVNSTIGGDFKIKTTKNWVFGVDYNYIFGSDIKQLDQLASLIRTEGGEIIDGNGTFALWDVFERGFSMNLKFGKIFPVFGSNPNSGLMLLGSGGYLQHKYKFDVENKTAPQLRDDYARGYDRLRGGVSTSEFIGYIYMGSSKVVNFFAGLEFVQAWTKDYRSYDFNTLQYTDGHYFDAFFGVKVGWFIPLHKRTPRKYYYY